MFYCLRLIELSGVASYGYLRDLENGLEIISAKCEYTLLPETAQVLSKHVRSDYKDCACRY